MSENPQTNKIISSLRKWIGGFSLQTQTWFVATISVGSAAAVLSILSFLTLGHSFRKIEDQAVNEGSQRLSRALAFSVDGLVRMARDYATWITTYEFVQKPNQEYRDANFSASVGSNLQLAGFMVFNREGKLVDGMMFPKGGDPTPPEVDLWQPIFEATAIASAKGDGVTLKGFKLIKDEIIMFASLPILKDDGSGPPRGAVVQIRRLDTGLIATLRDITGLDIKLHIGAQETDRTQYQPAYREQGTEFLVFKLPLLNSANAKLGHLEVWMQRQFYSQGKQAQFALLLGVLGGAAMAGLASVWLVRIFVISRLEKLNQEVKQIGENADRNARVSVEGKDEISSLSENMNRTLEALASSEQRTKVVEKKSEHLQEQLTQAQKMEAIGAMAGGLAHDFNNMLNSIMGSADILRYELPQAHPAQEHIRRIEKAGSNAAALVRQLLTVSRRQALKLEPIHLSEVVQDVLRLVRAAMPRTIEFTFQSQTLEDSVLADPSQIHQVIMNLATNAAHAMAGRERGSFQVTLSRAVLPISKHAETANLPKGEYLCLKLSDSGCGIADEILPHIFEPFYTTKPSGSGSGLGLAVVHGIVAKHNGAIVVESTVGVGTSVYIFLPKNVSREPKQAIHISSTQPGGQHHVLLIDDDRLVRDTLANGLKRKGHTVLCTSSGEEALALLRDQSTRIDILVTDQMMPGLTGFELGEQAQKLRPGLPMVLVSGYAAVLDDSGVQSRGFNRLLMKPISGVMLSEALDDALRQKPKGASNPEAP